MPPPLLLPLPLLPLPVARVLLLLLLPPMGVKPPFPPKEKPMEPASTLEPSPSTPFSSISLRKAAKKAGVTGNDELYRPDSTSLKHTSAFPPSSVKDKAASRNNDVNRPKLC